MDAESGNGSLFEKTRVLHSSQLGHSAEMGTPTRHQLHGMAWWLNLMLGVLLFVAPYAQQHSFTDARDASADEGAEPAQTQRGTEQAELMELGERAVHKNGARPHKNFRILREDMTQGRIREKRNKIDKSSLEEKKQNLKKPTLQVATVQVPNECKKAWLSDEDMLVFVKIMREKKPEQYLQYGGSHTSLCAAKLARRGTPLPPNSGASFLCSEWPSVTVVEHDESVCKKLQREIDNSSLTNIKLICSPVQWTLSGRLL